MTILSSRQNPVIQELRKRLQHPKGAWISLEGPHLLDEALKSNVAIEHLAVVPSLYETELVARAVTQAKRVTQMTPYVFKTLSEVEEPQGVIALCRKPAWNWEALSGKSPAPIVVLDGIQDPGNAATIVRSAEAAGAAGIVSTPATASLFSPKALRGAMGSTLRVPSIEHRPIPEIIEKLAALGYSPAGASMNQGEAYDDFDWSKPRALVFGQEGQGLSAEWEASLSTFIHIAMEPAVESINVAAAAAVLLFESRRQRSQ